MQNAAMHGLSATSRTATPIDAAFLIKVIDLASDGLIPMLWNSMAPDIPEAFVAIEELAKLVPGYWYINVIAVLPDARGKGVGSALLAEAEKQAREHGSAGLALIVAANNTGAIRAYLRAGYRGVARRPFALAEFGLTSTEAILMTKDVR